MISLSSLYLKSSSSAGAVSFILCFHLLLYYSQSYYRFWAQKSPPSDWPVIVYETCENENSKKNRSKDFWENENVWPASCNVSTSVCVCVGHCILTPPDCFVVVMSVRKFELWQLFHFIVQNFLLFRHENLWVFLHQRETISWFIPPGFQGKVI